MYKLRRMVNSVPCTWEPIVTRGPLPISYFIITNILHIGSRPVSGDTSELILFLPLGNHKLFLVIKWKAINNVKCD